MEGGPVYLTSSGSWQPEGALEASLSSQRADDWSYRTRGPRFGVSAVRTATSDGSGTYGLWGNATYYQPLEVFGLSGTGELGLRGGYQQLPPLPLELTPWAAVGTAGYRVSFPLRLRYGDGLYAAERLTVTPRLRAWYDGKIGLGGDLEANADLLLNYAAPVSFGITVGYAQRLWYRFGISLPL